MFKFDHNKSRSFENPIYTSWLYIQGCQLSRLVTLTNAIHVFLPIVGYAWVRGKLRFEYGRCQCYPWLKNIYWHFLFGDGRRDVQCCKQTRFPVPTTDLNEPNAEGRERRASKQISSTDRRDGRRRRAREKEKEEEGVKRSGFQASGNSLPRFHFQKCSHQALKGTLDFVC